MLTDFLSKINWIDVLMVVIIFRILFIGLKNGLITEAFKLFGAIFSVFIVLHYYIAFAGLIFSKLHFPKAVTLSLSFLILWALVTLIFKLIRDGLLLIFSIETQKHVDRWGGGVLSAVRALIICGLTFYLIILMGIDTPYRMAKTSISRRCFSPVAVGIYSMIYTGLVSKFFPNEKINNQALSVPQLLSVKK